ncbi:MAG: hypothetical protein ABSG09_08740, partial [Acidimicrobiales bacterium]
GRRLERCRSCSILQLLSLTLETYWLVKIIIKNSSQIFLTSSRRGARRRARGYLDVAALTTLVPEPVPVSIW